MSLQVEKLENNMAKLTIEVPANDLEKALQSAYMKQKNKIAMPGFRKGKVPRQMIEKMYGPEIFYDDAANALIPKAYSEAYDECDLEIVSRPEINIVQIEKGKSFIFTADVATKPEVKLGEYKGLEVDKVSTRVTQKEVDAKIQEEAGKNARTVTVEGRPVKDGDEVVLDGSTGEAFINPEASVVEEYKAKKAKFLEEKAALQKFVGQKSQTADGHVVELVANIGGPDEAEGVLERDGEGVGLFRSEFLFMESDAIPSEEAQFEAYKKVAETLDGKPVIIRTLDIGGDKALPYLGLPTEENPFLGFRAVRFCLQRKEDIYKPQLRALLRASAFGKVRIMVPLVTCVDELRAVKAIIEELKQELDAEGIAYDKDIQVGVMMETAAASLIADILAKEADFFSIGTNDLTGYTMAADRGNPDVAYLYSAYNPAVLRSIRNIISSANKEDIMAGMCGEAASDPLLVPVLLGFGLNEFSVSATAILATRKVMSLWTMDECKALVDEVMQLETEAEVKALLEERARS